MSDIKRTGRAHAATSLASAMATVGHDRGAIYTGAGLVVAIAASVAAVVAFTLVYWHALASEPLFSWAVVGCARSRWSAVCGCKDAWPPVKCPSPRWRRAFSDGRSQPRWYG